MSVFNTTITVEDLAELSQVHMADYEWGTTAWVKTVPFGTDGGLYVLLKSTALATNGTTVVQAISGSPIAGNAGARWVFVSEPAASPTSVDGFVYIRPIDGVSDDWVTLRATMVANAYKNIIVMLPGLNGEHFQCLTQQVTPNGTTIWMTQGTIIDMRLPGPPTNLDSAFAQFSVTSPQITLAANNTPGTKTLLLTANPGLPGTMIQLRVGVPQQHGSTYTIVSVVPAGPNFTVTVDRSIWYTALAASAGVYPIISSPQDIYIDGQGGTIQGFSQGCFIGFGGGINLRISNLILDATTALGFPAASGFLIDGFSINYTVSNVVVQGIVTAPATWSGFVMLGEDVELLDCTVSNCPASGLQAQDLVGCTVVGLVTYGNQFGVNVTSDGGANAVPGQSNLFYGTISYGNTSHGIQVSQGAINTVFEGGSSRYNGGHGFFISNTFTPSNGTKLTGMELSSNTQSGLSDSANCTGTVIACCDVSSNAASGVTCNGEMSITGLSVLTATDGTLVNVVSGECNIDGFTFTATPAVNITALRVDTGILRACHGRVTIASGAGAFTVALATLAGRMVLDGIDMVANIASTFITQTGTSVVSARNLDASGTAVGGSVGWGVGAGCTARIGERVNFDALIVPWSLVATSRISRSLDAVGASAAAGFLTVGGGGGAIVVAWPDIKSDDRIVLERVAPAPPPAGISMPTVTKILGTSFTVTPVGVADAGSVYAYCID